MNNIHLSNMVGLAATATVLGYSAFGEPIPQTDFFYKAENSAQQYVGQYDYYRLGLGETIPLSEQIEVLHEFSKSMLNNVKDIDPEFSALVDEKFWDLL